MVTNYFYLYQYPRLRRPATSAPAVADNASLFSFRTQATATPPLPTSPTHHHHHHHRHHHRHHQPVEAAHSHPHHHNHSRLSPPSLSRLHFPPHRRPSHPLLEFAFTRIFPAMSQTLHLIPASPPTPLAGVSSPRSATTPTASTSSSCVTASSPNASILHIPQLSVSIGTHEHANPRYRRRMEDRSVCTPLRRAGGVFLAVYDGHGGCEAARLVSEKLHTHFETSLESTSSSCVDTAGVRVSSLAPAELIRNAFLHAYSQTDRELRLARAFNVGAVAVTVYVTRNAAGARRMYVANAGDARVVLCRARRAERLTVDHRPNLFSERSRVLANGGFIAAGRVNGVLAVSRALGDHGMKSVVIAQPDFKEVLLRECDEFVIIACDGLWDVIDDSTAVRIAHDACDRGLSPNAIAKLLVDAAIAAGSTDNVSVIFASLDCD